MTEPRRTISPFLPLFVAVALVIGLLIGQSLGSNDGPLTVFNFQQPSAADKVGQVLDLIDRQYVDTVEKNALVEEVIQDMLQRLDPHSYYLSAAELRAAEEPLEGSFDGIGVEFAIQRDTVVVVSPVDGGPSARVGILAGDRILKADTVRMAGVNITNDGVMRSLRGPEGSKVVVTLLRRSRPKPFEVTIERGKIPINSIAVAIMQDDGTGYVKLSRFAKNTHEEFLAAANKLKLQGMKRMVLDLRGNGGGFLNAAVDLADEFLPNGRRMVYTEGRSSPRRDFIATSDGLYETIPLAVLIDEGSASASEIIAGALQDNDRALIVGRRSFGKGLVQEQVPLPDESAVRITTARYYTPSGRSIQKPYGSGIDYDADYEGRFEHGELLRADSIHMDTSKVYHTLSGRKVFGGGGIMPDAFVPTDTAQGSSYLSELFFSGTLNEFAFDIVDRSRAKLSAYGSYQAFARSYQVSDQMRSALKDAATKHGIEVREADAVRSKDQIALRLKASIARGVWGDEGFYYIMLQADEIYERASTLLLEGKLATAH